MKSVNDYIPGGYGLVYQRIMRDENISREAKALYAYLASFAGTSGKAFPSRTIICRELGMGKDLYTKCKKELQEHKIIDVQQERGNQGTFQKNIFVIKQF